MLDQQVHDSLVTASSGAVQRSQSVLRRERWSVEGTRRTAVAQTHPSGSVDLRASRQQQVHHVSFAPLAGYVKGSDLVLRREVDVRMVVEEKEGDVLVAVVSCDV